MRTYLVTLFLALSLVFVPAVTYADGLVIDCALERPDGTGSTDYCNDVNDLVRQAIVIAQFVLGLAGSIALLMFVYGGFMFLTAFGKADQAKKGQQVLVAAVVGLIITFSAYLIVDFVVAGIGLDPTFLE